MAPRENLGKIESIARESFKSLSLKNAIRVRQNMRIGHFRKPCNKNDAPAREASSKKPEEREFVVDSGASMHMPSKKDSSSDEMDTLWRSRTRRRCRPQMEKCTQTRKHKCTFKISICSSQCNYLIKREQFYRLVSFAQNTDVHMSGKTAKPHD